MKRIRVEMDVPNSTARELADSSTTEIGHGPAYAFAEIRSVEVVKPERWTELVLRRDRARDHILVAGDEVSVAGGGLSYWRVVSCTEREKYPNG